MEPRSRGAARRWCRRLAGLSLLGALLPAWGCAHAPQPLQDRLTRLSDSLDRMVAIGARELARPARLPRDARTLVTHISPADLRRSIGRGPDIIRREVARPRTIPIALKAVGKELKRAGRFSAPDYLAWDILSREPARMRVAAYDVQRLLSAEFTWRLSRDPRRLDRSGAALLPKPLSLGDALIQSLPLW